MLGRRGEREREREKERERDRSNRTTLTPAHLTHPYRMQKILRDSLEKQGYAVDIVWDIEEAVSALSRGSRYIVAIVGVDTDSPKHKAMPEGARVNFPGLITCRLTTVVRKAKSEVAWIVS